MLKNLGYAIVNFTSGSCAREAVSRLDGVELKCRRILATWSKTYTGIHSLIERYANRSLLKSNILDDYKPLFMIGGSASSRTSTGDRAPKNIGKHPKSTVVVLRHLPGRVRRAEVMEFLNRNGYDGLYNFVHLPLNFQTITNMGHVIVNFTSQKVADDAFAELNGMQMQGVDIDVVWINCHTGLQSLIHRYQNSRVMDADIADEFKPILLSHGQRLTFPIAVRS